MTRFSYNNSGVIGGAHVGYNLQLNQFVIGLEGDVDGSSRSSKTSLLFGSSLRRRPALPRSSARSPSPSGMTSQGSIRGRVGYAWDRVLLYATGGVAFGGFNAPSGTSPAVSRLPRRSLSGYDSASTTRVGWTVGGGLEYAITNNWSVRAEYRYTDFGHSTIYATSFDSAPLGAAGAFVNRHFNENRVQVGFSYKFDTAVPAPVVAKY